MMLADRAALKEDNERLRAVLEQSERFGVALSKRYENTKAELAANEVRARCSNVLELWFSLLKDTR
jgi:hypothetical protein